MAARKHTPADPEDELAALIREQRRAQQLERRGRSEVRGPRNRQLARAATAPRHAVRYSGDELRAEVLDRARRALQSAGCKIPARLLEGRDAQKRRYRTECQAARAHAQLAAVVDKMRRLAELEPRHVGPATAYTAESFRIIERVLAELDHRKRHPELAAITEFQSLMEAMRNPFRAATRSRGVELPPWIRPPRVMPTSRGRIARLEGRPWTNRLRACASLLLGNWPRGVTGTEMISPDKVIELEAETIKTTRTATGKSSRL